MKKFYAVSKGYERGIYTTWSDCYKQVHGYSGALFKGFKTLEEAKMFLSESHEGVSHDLSQKKEDYTIKESPCNERFIRDAKSEGKRICLRKFYSLPSDSNVDDNCSEIQSIAKCPRLYDSTCRNSCHIATQSAESPPVAPRDSLITTEDVYVDGACHGNGQQGFSKAGYGGYYGEGDCRNFALPLLSNEKQTNNRAELRAVIYALRQGVHDAGGSVVNLMANRVDYSTPTPLYRLRVYSDSKYVVEGLTKYSKKWMRNGFTLSDGKTPVQNQDLWKELIQLRDGYNTCFSYQHDAQPRYYCSSNISNSGEGFEICHVRGHSNIHGNEMADYLASIGASKHVCKTSKT
ncbi:unnamed protein product [Phytomonas sp. Hart1]|nr:unnamed protein product [Phytomonas sp. Hart1]|eukprot:CCW71230.1 unnamed protein product [Phytomonas sp. isolate Hart1]